MQFDKAISGKKQGLADAQGWPAETFIVGQQGSPPDTIVWGDSYTEAMIPGFVSYHRATGRGAIIASRPGCQPLIGISLYQDKGCELHNAEIFTAILQHSAKRVILIGFWSAVAKGIVRNSDGSVAYREHGQKDGPVFEAALRSMIGKLTERGKDVVIVGPIPLQKFEVAPAVARHIIWNEPLPRELTRAEFIEDKATILDIFARMAALPRVRVVYPDKGLCDAQGCRYVENNVPLYFRRPPSLSGRSGQVDRYVRYYVCGCATPSIERGANSNRRS